MTKRNWPGQSSEPGTPFGSYMWVSAFPALGSSNAAFPEMLAGSWTGRTTAPMVGIWDAASAGGSIT